jgi:hypothetical protein
MISCGMRGTFLSNPTMFERATNLDIYHTACHYLYKVLYAVVFKIYLHKLYVQSC